MLLFPACSTQKNRFLNKAYHNTTAHYNGYFNARESFKEGVKSLEESHKEDYMEILPVFIYGADGASRAIYPQMDRAIEKCSKVIQRHSMYIKGEEYCKWIDDSYLLVGKANFYKKDYEPAVENFEFVAKEFKDEPTRYHAMMWLARTYTGMGRYSKANAIFTLIERDKDFPDKLRPQLAAAKADNHFKNDNIAATIHELNQAVSLAKKKKFRVRMLFILAQLYEEQGNSNMATAFYTQVIKENPGYEMAFYAKINQALAYETGGGMSEEIKKQLFKMLKDAKNKEFKDQIYYALAEIALKEKDEPQAIEYLLLSTQNSISNDRQKGLSFLRLGKIHLKNKKYADAQLFYDSTTVFLPKKFPGYEEAFDTRNSLTRLVRNINIVNREDSLQRLAAMSPGDRGAVIDDIIQSVMDEEDRKRRERETQMLLDQSVFADQQSNRFDDGSGGWYFYNATAVAFGETEFKKLWGSRPLEDNWRRITKSLSGSGDDFEEGDRESLSLGGDSASLQDLKNRSFYLQHIPLDSAKMKASDQRIIEALYDMGLVYKEELQDKPQACLAYENLLQRYDTSKNHLSSHYQLYRLYLGNDSRKSDYHKDYILNQHPGSEYAQLIQQPGKLDRKAGESEIEDLYQNTYTYYKRGHYQKVISNAYMADSLASGHADIPKFKYLRALSIGKTAETPEFIAALEEVVSNCSGTDVAVQAQRTLNLLKKDLQEELIAEKQEEVSGKYKFLPNTKHTFVLVFPNKGFSANDLKTYFSDYNSEYFKPEKLSVSNVFLDKDQQMISIKEFNNKEKAMNYYKAYNENEDYLKNINKSEKCTPFIISYENFATFYQDKNIQTYLDFFKQNYE